MSKFKEIDRYYTSKIKQHGATARGVDWNGKSSQFIRFDQLYKLMEGNIDEYVLNDIGCGYGEFINYLNEKKANFKYRGYDVSLDMIKKGIQLHPDKSYEFIHITKNDFKVSEYSIASGIFNLKFENTNENWNEFVKESLISMNKCSIKGFAFNVLTKYSDRNLMKKHLYYADPLDLFDFCKKNFSKNVSLLHDYDLYEFTIIVRKGN